MTEDEQFAIRSALAYTSLSLHEQFTVAAVDADMTSRLKLNTVAAGHFARFAELSQGIRDLTKRFNALASAMDSFGKLTRPANRAEQMLRLSITVGIFDDLENIIAKRLSGSLAKLIAPGPENWRSTDAVNSEILAYTQADESAVGMLAIYGRRVISETLLLIQMTAARQTALSNVLSGSTSTGIDDLNGVAELMEELLDSARAKLRHLGFTD